MKFGLPHNAGVRAWELAHAHVPSENGAKTGTLYHGKSRLQFFSCVIAGVRFEGFGYNWCLKFYTAPSSLVARNHLGGAGFLLVK